MPLSNASRPAASPTSRKRPAGRGANTRARRSTTPTCTRSWKAPRIPCRCIPTPPCGPTSTAWSASWARPSGRTGTCSRSTRCQSGSPTPAGRTSPGSMSCIAWATCTRRRWPTTKSPATTPSSTSPGGAPILSVAYSVRTAAPTRPATRRSRLASAGSTALPATRSTCSRRSSSSISAAGRAAGDPTATGASTGPIPRITSRSWNRPRRSATACAPLTSSPAWPMSPPSPGTWPTSKPSMPSGMTWSPRSCT